MFLILYFLKEAVGLKVVQGSIEDKPIGEGINWEDENNTDIIKTWYIAPKNDFTERVVEVIKKETIQVTVLYFFHRYFII